MNKRYILAILSLIIIFVTTYVIIACARVGAEYILNKAVYTSPVDGVMTTTLAYYITRDMYKLLRKCGGKKK